MNLKAFYVFIPNLEYKEILSKIILFFLIAKFLFRFSS